jgi:AcrR family transcriptional regulator
VRCPQDEERRKADWRESIVMTAAGLFLKNGIEPVAMTDIAKACDIGVATLYRYYGTKAGIVVEAGALLWKDLLRLFDGIFETDGYRSKSGMAQIEELLGFFLRLYREQQPFLRFVQQFDRFVLAEKVPPEKLLSYQAHVLDLYPLFEAAYEKACREGSARPGLPAALVYASVSHALMAVSQKFLAGDVLPSDAVADKDAELARLVDITLYYLKAAPTV